MKNNKTFLFPPLGAHTSTSGGVFNAIKEGQEIEADVVQIFSKNQWNSQAGKTATRELGREKLASPVLRPFLPTNA